MPNKILGFQKIFSFGTIKSAVKYTLLLNIFVFENADSLMFIKQDSLIDTWLMCEEIQPTETGEISHIKKAKVSEDRKYFIIYEETYYIENDSIITNLSLFNSNKKKLWQKSAEHDRQIFFDLTNIYGDVVVLVTTDRANVNPSVDIIKSGVADKIIEKDVWRRIMNYAISPNLRFLVLHLKNLHQNRPWDFIYFIDVENKDTWTYLFPICISCKRHKIDLNIDDQGTAEVIYKGEHRIFSKDGKMIDVFIKL